MNVTSFRVPAFCDMHVHLRQAEDEFCPELLRQHARHSDLLMAMPNTTPPLDNGNRLQAYRDGLDLAWGAPTHEWIKLAWYFDLAHGTIGMQEMADVPGVIAAKVYPRNMTHNSSMGLPPELIVKWKDGDRSLDLQLGVMSELGIVLSIHPEVPLDLIAPGMHYNALDGTEMVWISFIKEIVARFGRLKVVVEHVTTAGMIDYVGKVAPKDRVAATVTPQHLAWHLGDLFDGGLLPMRYCKPIYKMPRDQSALWGAVAHHGNVFLGSDSAPHKRQRKLDVCGCAGVYSAPVLAEVLARGFDEHGWLFEGSVFADFTSQRARAFYGLDGGLSKATESFPFRYAPEVDFARKTWAYRTTHPNYETAWDGVTFDWRADRSISIPDAPQERQP